MSAISIEHDIFGDAISSVQLVRASPDNNWIGAVADAARVSVLTAKRRRTDGELVRSLIRRKHVSTLSHVTMTWKVVLPIFVARQWMRHWSWKYNEASARYSEMPKRFYIPRFGRIERQSKKEHQGGDESFGVSDQARLLEIIESSTQYSWAQYEKLIEEGVSRELARIVLPVNLYTEFYATCSLRDWLFFLQQRLDDHAQWEIRQYANAMTEIVRTYVDQFFMDIVIEELGLNFSTVAGMPQ